MRDFTLPGATTLAQIPTRRFTALASIPVGTLLDMYEETLEEIRLVCKADYFRASKKNGFYAISDALEKMGVDAVRELERRRRPSYSDSGMYLNQKRNRFTGVE